MVHLPNLICVYRDSTLYRRRVEVSREIIFILIIIGLQSLYSNAGWNGMQCSHQRNENSQPKVSDEYDEPSPDLTQSRWPPFSHWLGTRTQVTMFSSRSTYLAKPGTTRYMMLCIADPMYLYKSQILTYSHIHFPSPNNHLSNKWLPTLVMRTQLQATLPTWSALMRRLRIGIWITRRNTSSVPLIARVDLFRMILSPWTILLKRGPSSYLSALRVSSEHWVSSTTNFNRYLNDIMDGVRLLIVLYTYLGWKDKTSVKESSNWLDGQRGSPRPNGPHQPWVRIQL